MIAECDSCGFKTKLTEYVRSGLKYPGEKKRLCNICGVTLVGAVIDYPDCYPNEDVLRMIGYVGNMILAAIEKASRL